MVTRETDTLPTGCWTLMGTFENNQEWIVPSAWREFGEAECLRLLRELRVMNLKERKRILICGLCFEGFHTRSLSRTFVPSTQ